MFGAGVEWLGAIGNQADENDEQRLSRQFLLYMGVLMSFGGLLWGTIAASFGLLLPAAVPYGYVVLTVGNFWILHQTRAFGPSRWFQVFISLLLPFLFQWSLGGFVASGGVMLWAMLAIVGSLTFSSARQSLGWLALYLALTVFSGLIDSSVRSMWSAEPSMDVTVAFLVINITVISAIVFGLTIYLMVRREQALDDLQEAHSLITRLNEGLEVEVTRQTLQVRRALRERQAVLDHLADGLVAADGEATVRIANPRLTELLGLENDPVGKELGEGLPAGLARAMGEASRAGLPSSLEIPLPGERIGQVAVAPILDDEGAHGCVALVRDVTLEKEIDRMKTDFIATVSHELRTPLTSVLGFAKITRNRLEDRVFPHVPEEQKRAHRAVAQVRNNIDIIISEGERLTLLINDVLDISKMEAGRMEWRVEAVDVEALVEQATRAVASLFPLDGPIVLHTEVDEGLPVLRGDRDRLIQVLINLLSNAAKFTERGEVIVRARTVDGGVELAVRDTGMGIEPSLQTSVFEKFRQVGDTLTAKPQGTGLGLSICRQIVQAHGGTLGLESALGDGSTFTAYLPVDAEVGAARPRREVTPAPVPDEALRDLVRTIEEKVSVETEERSGACEVLVADDDPNLRELLRQELSERGYEVRLAANGFEALGQVKARRPDLLILDVMMPELSGFDVAALLKADPSTASLPILVLSIVRDDERGQQVGVDRYLTKPASAETLHEAVRELLGDCGRGVSSDGG